MSCGNLVKHGLSGRGIVLPEAKEQAVAERLAERSSSYEVRRPDEEFALGELVRESVRTIVTVAATPEPVEPPRNVSRQQRRALARRRPEPVLA
jgi:hypothetical protein